MEGERGVICGGATYLDDMLLKQIVLSGGALSCLDRVDPMDQVQQVLWRGQQIQGHTNTN